VADQENKPFWKTKTLRQMTSSEWESLCDGCGKCCLVKLIDNVTDELHFTSVACRLLDCNSCRCGDYKNRKDIVSDCVSLSPRLVKELQWMPSTCAYRLISEGKNLEWWHPLLSGTGETVHEAGISVQGRAISERNITDESLPDYIVDWPK
jgi:uncharacterized cysteine cluster protein YcgN (CxxCxxCC family)